MGAAERRRGAVTQMEETGLLPRVISVRGRAVPQPVLPSSHRKRCTACKRRRKIRFFNKKTASKDGLQSECQACNRTQAKEYYQDNKVVIKAAATQSHRRRLKVAREKICEYLTGHPCIDCGEPDIVVLDFDHVSGKKRMAVSTLIHHGVAWNIVELEIAKCVVRCANCHRRKTAKYGNHFRHVYAQRKSGP